jgi:hypothetical protein
MEIPSSGERTKATRLAAKSGPVSFVTADAAGNLATTNFNPQSLASLQNNVSTLQTNVGVLQTQMKQAFERTALSIGARRQRVAAGQEFANSASFGTFRGQNAMAFGAQLRLSQNVVLNGGVAAGFAEGGVGGRAGVKVAW